MAMGGCGESEAGPDGRLTEPSTVAGVGTGPVRTRTCGCPSTSDTVGYDGSPEYPDALGGPFGGLVVTANGGKVESVPGAPGRGLAVAFPPKCDDGHRMPAGDGGGPARARR